MRALPNGLKQFYSIYFVAILNRPGAFTGSDMVNEGSLFNTLTYDESIMTATAEHLFNTAAYTLCKRLPVLGPHDACRQTGTGSRIRSASLASNKVAAHYWRAASADAKR